MENKDAVSHYPNALDDLVAFTFQQIRIKFEREGPFSSPTLVADFLRLKLSLLEREVFAVLFLCNRHFMIAYEEMFLGTINGATVHPREIAKRALSLNAAAIILAHNHPSGIPEPSQSDIALTNKIVDAMALLDIRVLDHLVIGGSEYVSFSDRGIL